jgi:predicted RNase H-like nuclease
VLPEVTAAVTGVDGCAGGWVAVTLGPVGPSAAPRSLSATHAPEPSASPAREHGPGHRQAAAPVTGTAEAAGPLTVGVAVAATLDGLPLTGVTGIDMPLGLLSADWRDADQLARRALGRRGVTVFAIPPRPVWECETYAEANQACRELTGKGLSIQAWGLRRKIAEADEFRRAATARDSVHLYEVHPELSFAAMAGAPLPDSKHTQAGLAIRRALLARAGIALPLRITGAAEDDLLDAAAVAWSVRRIAAGEAVALTSPGQRADDGTEIAIRY